MFRFLSNLSNSNSFNTDNSFNNITNNITVADDRSEILAWLSPLEPRIRHQDLRTQRVDGVGQWLLQTEQFRSWCGSRNGTRQVEPENATIFCYGGPGAGKTYISSLVIDTLCDEARGQNVAVACIYLDFAAQKEQSPTSILGSLLKQIVAGLEEIPDKIVQAYEDQQRVIGGRGLRLPEIVEMLQTTSLSQPTFICIDALDECVVGCRFKVLTSLKQILEKSPNTRVFLTGRPHIRGEVENRLSRRAAILSVSPNKDDIISYIRARLDEDPNPDAMDSRLEAEILKIIPETVSEIFLLVSLNIEAILRETTISRRRKRLNTMTNGLGIGDAYGATLERIKAQGVEKSRLGMAVLMWISYSERPLQTDELCHALAVEIGSKDIDTDNVPSIQTLLDCCQGLIVVEREASTVRLIHFTLQEYLRTHPNLFSRAHSTIAETCLTYLNSQPVKELSTNPSQDLHHTPFLRYSSVHWGAHARRELSECGMSLALELFDQWENHISAKLLLEQARVSGFMDLLAIPLFTSLHCASYFGIVEVVAALIEVKGCDINQWDCAGITPLVWAAMLGHEGLVKLLLSREDIDPDLPDKSDHAPLSWAAENGHEGIVKLLLEQENVNPELSDILSGRTALSRAAENGREGAVRLLLSRKDVHPDRLDRFHRTPLSWAAENGHERVVKLLLSREDVHPDIPDSTLDRTPLWWAAENGHEGTVRLLLSRADVNPDRADKIYRTPLWRAAENGHEGVARLLLGREDVNPERTNELGWTPLSRAADNGHEGVVRLLLSRDDINPDRSDKHHHTPLSQAAGNGHEGVVRLLLSRKDVTPDRIDPHYGTSLAWAAENGHEGVVRLLLSRKDVIPDRSDKFGNTPLSRAAENGREEVVAVLLSRDEVDPDRPDTALGRTPLWRAADKGHEGVARLLLSRDEVNPNSSDKYDMTPLARAAQNGHEGVVRLLLSRIDVNPDTPDRVGHSPMSWAAVFEHERIVELLRARIAGITSNI